jgi:hypothetical protein
LQPAGAANVPSGYFKTPQELALWSRAVGYNWSDNIVTGESTGYRMSFVPYSKEFLFVKL